MWNHTANRQLLVLVNHMRVDLSYIFKAKELVAAVLSHGSCNVLQELL